MEEIYLKQITKYHKSAFIKVSDRLGNGEAKLNCQDVANLKPKQINWLLDRIPADWQNTEELYSFFGCFWTSIIGVFSLLVFSSYSLLVNFSLIKIYVKINVQQKRRMSKKLDES